MTAPLLQRRIIITRPKGQETEMAQMILDRGGIPIEMPLLHIVSVQLEALSPGGYDWLIFTSKNAVHHFFSQITEPWPDRVRIAAVGAKTKRAVEGFGYEAAFVPSEFVAEAFLAEFLKVVQEGARVLFPHGDLARDVIAAGLRGQGVQVEERIVYETKPRLLVKEQLVRVLENGEADVITFTSPSAVETFVSLLEGTNWRQWVKRCTIGCIGPVTERAAARYFSALVVPAQYTVEGLLDAIAASGTRTQ